MPDISGHKTLYSRDSLSELVAGDPQQLRELLSLYCRNQAEILAQLNNVSGSDLQRMAQLAHRLAGAARGVAATHLTSSCESLERAARASDESQALLCRKELLAAAADVARAIEEDLAVKTN